MGLGVEDRGDEVASTAGVSPALVWMSGPCATRRDAAAFEGDRVAP